MAKGFFRKITILTVIVAIGFVAFFLLSNKIVTVDIDKFVDVITKKEPKYIEQFYPSQNGELVGHTYYSLSYREEYEQPEWVVYLLTQESINGAAQRKNNFIEDPEVSTHTEDSKNSWDGFDRGHLCPAADMKLNQQAINETFYYSNMSPQYPDFNRRTWNKLEDYVRKCASKVDSLIVITGPVFGPTTDSVLVDGHNVPVATHYYKILYYPQHDMMQAFLLEHKAKYSRYEIKDKAVSVDDIEALTGIDFFCKMNILLQDDLESQNDYKSWQKRLKKIKANNKKNN